MFIVGLNYCISDAYNDKCVLNITTKLDSYFINYVITTYITHNIIMLEQHWSKQPVI